MAVPILVQLPQPNLRNGEGSSAAKTARGKMTLPQAVALGADTYVASRGIAGEGGVVCGRLSSPVSTRQADCIVKLRVTSHAEHAPCPRSQVIHNP